jgi:catechol 2,3-dioxygenase-like lactoylglutathione lyase family enzyme
MDTMTGFATIAMISLECANPAAQARFYADMLGWDVTHSEDEYAMISDGSSSIGWGRRAGYQPPNWTEGGDEVSPKRYHLDVYVADLDDGEAQAVKLGATRPDFQPGADRWRVMLDPDGHPFCLCKKS